MDLSNKKIQMQEKAKQKVEKLKELNKAVMHLAKRLGLKSYVILIIFFIALLVFRKAFVSIAAILIMIVIAAAVALHKRITVVSVGIELYTFFAVILTYSFGPLIASIACIMMIGLGDFFSSREPVYTMAKMVIYPLLCVLTFVLSGFDINLKITGMIIVVLMNIIFFFVWGILSQFSFFWGPVTIAVSIITNYFLFSRLGEILVKMLTYF